MGRRLSHLGGAPISEGHAQWVAAMASLGALVGPLAVRQALTASLPFRDLDFSELECNVALSAREGIAANPQRMHGSSLLSEHRTLVDEVREQIEVNWPQRQVWAPARDRDRGPSVQRFLHGLFGMVWKAGTVWLADPVNVDDFLVRSGSWTQSALDRLGPPTFETRSALTVLEAPPQGRVLPILQHGLHLWNRGEVDGLSVFLPTRNAAMHVYEEVLELLGPGHPPAVLALPFEHVLDGEERSHWATTGSSYFAAPIIIGTMEQAFNAIRVSNSRQFVNTRMAWLSRSLLVLDGVSPGDVRQLGMCAALIRSQLHLGGFASVVSTGLDAFARKFLGFLPMAELPGFSGDWAQSEYSTRSIEQERTEPYNSVWRSTAYRNSDGEPRTRLSRLTRASRLDPPTRLRVGSWVASQEDVTSRAINAAREGLRVLVVKRTNSSCVATVLEAISQGASDVLVSVDHQPVTLRSRYAFEDRKAVDEEVRRCFARGTTGGCLLVATPLVDHGRHFEFDLILSDSAPTDSLIHRVSLLRDGGELVVTAPSEDDINEVLRGFQGEFTWDRCREWLESEYHHVHLDHSAVTRRRNSIATRWASEFERLTTMYRRGEPFNSPDVTAPLFLPTGEPRSKVVFEDDVWSPLNRRMTVLYVARDPVVEGRRIIPDRIQVGSHVELTFPGSVTHRYDSLGYHSGSDEDVDEEDDQDDGDSDGRRPAS